MQQTKIVDTFSALVIFMFYSILWKFNVHSLGFCYYPRTHTPTHPLIDHVCRFIWSHKFDSSYQSNWLRAVIEFCEFLFAIATFTFPEIIEIFTRHIEHTRVYKSTEHNKVEQKNISPYKIYAE